MSWSTTRRFRFSEVAVVNKRAKLFEYVGAISGLGLRTFIIDTVLARGNSVLEDTSLLAKLFHLTNPLSLRVRVVAVFKTHRGINGLVTTGEDAVIATVLRRNEAGVLALLWLRITIIVACMTVVSIVVFSIGFTMVAMHTVVAVLRLASVAFVV